MVNGCTHQRAWVSGGIEVLEGRQMLAGGYPDFAVIDVGTLGGAETAPADLNIKGQVVGVTQNSAGQARGFLWTMDGGMKDLGNFEPRAINRSGQIVGTRPPAIYEGPETSSAIWKGGRFRELGAPRGYTFAARDINASGVVVGTATKLSNGTMRPFLWRNGKFKDLSKGTRGSWGTAEAINDNGVVVGSLEGRAYVFGEGPVGPKVESVAYDIGGDGTVVGMLAAGRGGIDRSSHAFVRPAGKSKIKDLGTLAGPTARLKGVNNRGEAVGSSDLRVAPDTSPTMWTARGGMVDVSKRYSKEPGWDFCCGKSINDRGQITGIVRVNGRIHVYLATPDNSAPKASLSGKLKKISSSSGSFSFTVKYRDDAALDVSTLDGDDVRVRGPRGFDQAAQFVSVDIERDGAVRRATYRIAAPGGAWDARENGLYTITLKKGGVRDVVRRPIGGKSLGSLRVNIEARESRRANESSRAQETRFPFLGSWWDQPDRQGRQDSVLNDQVASLWQHA